MMRAMTAFCAVATAFLCAAPSELAFAAPRARATTETLHEGGKSRAATESSSRESRASALPDRGHPSAVPHGRPERGVASTPSRLTRVHDDARSTAAVDGARRDAKDGARTKGAAGKGRAADEYDGVVEFEEPSDVAVPGRSRSIVKLEATREDAPRGKKHGKGRVVRPTPANASWRPYVREPWRRGYVSVAGHGKTWSGFVVDKNGDVLPAGRRGLSGALASWRTGHEMLIDERLIALIADVSDVFGGRPIRIVSGYRETSWAPGSKHKVGQAFDFSVPGVPNEALRDFLRTLPDVGVGYYPNSTHVHLDVREKPCYWVDYSAPGAHPLYSYDRRVAKMNPQERMLAAALDALAAQREPLGRPATELAVRRAPSMPAVSEPPATTHASEPPRAAFEPVELANPSRMLVGSSAIATGSRARTAARPNGDDPSDFTR